MIAPITFFNFGFAFLTGLYVVFLRVSPEGLVHSFVTFLVFVVFVPALEAYFHSALTYQPIRVPCFYHKLFAVWSHTPPQVRVLAQFYFPLKSYISIIFVLAKDFLYMLVTQFVRASLLRTIDMQDLYIRAY